MNPAHSTSPEAHRFVLAIEYCGAHFCGWQRQKSRQLPSVQSALEQALSQVADRPVSVVCAGRTDAGVHATCQIVHFDCEIDRGDKAWTQGVNSLLPQSIRVLWSKTVEREFHARFSAEARRYVYVMYCASTAPALLASQLCHLPYELDVERMNQAAQFLVGEQDFSAFQASGCQSATPFRRVMEATVQRVGAFCVFDVRANAFLQHMVRNLSGTLISIGRGERKPEWVEELLRGRDRTLAGITAEPNGLYLMQVDYPNRFGLPETGRLPLILASSGREPDRTS